MHGPRALRARTLAAFAAVAALAALATWGILPGAPEPPRFPSRFVFHPPAGLPLRLSPFESTLAISRDGRHLVYSSRQMDTSTRLSGTSGTLMLRALDSLEPRPVAAFGRSPFFSPDGAWIGFFDDNDVFLKKRSLAGGSAVNICAFSGGPRGASWGDDGTIVFATGDRTTGLFRVAAGGGEPTVLTTPDVTQGGGDHLFPSVLPGGRGVLFTIAEPGQPDRAQIAVLDTRTGQYRVVLHGGTQPEYVDRATSAGSAPFLQEPFAQSSPDVSPNDRYLAYQSNESGRFEIHVRPFPDVHGGKWQISSGGGTHAAWAAIGRELFFVDGTQAGVSVPVETSGAFSWGNPVKVLANVDSDYAVNSRGYDITRDGKRFLMLKDESGRAASARSAHLVLILNWFEELKARLPPR